MQASTRRDRDPLRHFVQSESGVNGDRDGADFDIRSLDSWSAPMYISWAAPIYSAFVPQRPL